MQPVDPNITPVSIAANATTFSIFLVLFVLIDHTFLPATSSGHLSTATIGC